MHDVFVSVLASGSSGNAFLVVNHGAAILVDAGLSRRELEKRMSVFGVEPTQVEAVLLTHEHTDHVRGAKSFCQGNDVCAYGSRGTLSLTPLDGVEKSVLETNVEQEIAGVKVRPFKVKHLAAEPVAFSFRIDSVKLSIASDLGSVTPHVVREMAGSDVMLIEANYDEKMLMDGEYPEFLKQAIKGDNGHLSNSDAGALARSAAAERTKDIMLVHLSKENNTPELARSAVESALRESAKQVRLTVAEHGVPSGPYTLR